MKIALVAFNGEAVCFAHVLLNALDMVEKGNDVKVIIEGAATQRIGELNDKDKPFGPLYLKVKDKEGFAITDFDPPLELHIRYSASAWEKSANSALGKVAGRPRVYYLQKNPNDTWEGDWVEFDVDDTKDVHPPPDDFSYGYITIYTYTLPDPKIGGC